MDDMIPAGGGAEDELYRFSSGYRYAADYGRDEPDVYDYDEDGDGENQDPYAHLGYYACCSACMLRITSSVFCYGTRCTCVYHFECLVDTEDPTLCTRHCGQNG